MSNDTHARISTADVKATHRTLDLIEQQLAEARADLRSVLEELKLLNPIDTAS